MSLSVYFDNEIIRFQNTINKDYNLIGDDLLDYKVAIGYNRCLSRLRDYKTRDVNKRCLNGINEGDELCKRCITKNKYGKVTEMIPEDNALYKTYKKKDANFERGYRMNEMKIFCEYREEDYLEVMRKYTKRISKNNSIQMGETIDIENIYNNLENYINLDDIKETNIEDVLTLHNLVIKQKNEIIKKMKLRLTIGETEEFYDKIMRYIKECNVDDEKSSPEDEGEQIILREFNNAVDLYMVKKDDGLNSYNVYYNSKNGYRLIGYGRDWIDEEGEVPTEHKNYENKVLDEDTRLPILEIEITTDGSFITGIPVGKYREWEYDDEVEQFRRTTYIERLS